MRNSNHCTLYGLSPVWILLCRTNWLGFWKHLWQVSHLWMKVLRSMLRLWLLCDSEAFTWNKITTTNYYNICYWVSELTDRHSYFICGNLKSWAGEQLSWLRWSMILLSLSRQMAEKYLKLGHWSFSLFILSFDAT